MVSSAFIELEANVLLFVQGEVVAVVIVIVAYLGEVVGAYFLWGIAKPVRVSIQGNFSA